MASTKPRMLLICEKSDQMQSYIGAYRKYYRDIPYQVEFATLQGHVDEIRGAKEDKAGKWTLDNSLFIPQGFKDWDFEPNAVNSSKSSPYILNSDYGKRYYDGVMEKFEKYPDIQYLGIGTDDDVEGSFLAAAFISMLPDKYQKLPRLRLFIDDLSDESIVDGFQHMHRMTDLLPDGKSTYNSHTNSGILRSQANYVMGVALTKALTVKTGVTTNVGYVKAPIIQLVSYRYQQFIDFKPKDYFELDADIHHPEGDFKAHLINIKDKNNPVRFNNKDRALQFIDTLSNKGKIIDVKKAKVLTKAPQFYKLTKLQGVLNRRYNMSLNRSMDVIEKLYKKNKVLTYPRTTSNVISKKAVGDLPDIIRMCSLIPQLKPYANHALELNRFDEVAKDKRFVNDKKVNVHPALMLNPKVFRKEGEKVFNWDKFSQEERQVLFEVALSNLLPFLELKESLRKKVQIECEGHDEYRWNATDTTVIKPGWSALVHKQSTNDGLKQCIPNVKKDDVVGIAPDIQSKQTTPLSLFTIASLTENLDTLTHAEELLSDPKSKDILKQFKGIGTPATRGNIITTLFNKKFLRLSTAADKKKYGIPVKHVIPTENGLQLNKILNELHLMQLDDVVDFEDDIYHVQLNEMDPKEFQDKYFTLAKNYIENVKKIEIDKSQFSKKENIVGKCPVCGGNVISQKTFFNCANRKIEKDEAGNYHVTGCTFSMYKKPFGLKHELSDANAKKLLSGKKTGKLKFHSKKKDKDFEGYLYFDNASQDVKLTFK